MRWSRKTDRAARDDDSTMEHLHTSLSLTAILWKTNVVTKCGRNHEAWKYKIVEQTGRSIVKPVH